MSWKGDSGVKVWTQAEGYLAVDGRDRDRSALSDVPKRSGDGGMFSHHHRQLRSRGGQHSPANIVLLLGSGSSSEHAWVHRHAIPAGILGYLVPSWEDPAEVPIFRTNAFGTGYGWFLQTHDEQLDPCDAPFEKFGEAEVLDALGLFDSIRIASRLDAIRDL